MPFHRTPAQMAADASFARSPAGESQSRHMLWLNDMDETEIGPEPETGKHEIDFDDAGEVVSQREIVRIWKEWWGRVCARVAIRQRQALADPVWAQEYTRLLAERRAAGPAEMAAMQEQWEAFDAANPERGLTEAEEARRVANNVRRSELLGEYHRLLRRSPQAPRLQDILSEMRICDRENDSLYKLSRTRLPTRAAA